MIRVLLLIIIMALFSTIKIMGQTYMFPADTNGLKTEWELSEQRIEEITQTSECHKLFITSQNRSLWDWIKEEINEGGITPYLPSPSNLSFGFLFFDLTMAATEENCEQYYHRASHCAWFEKAIISAHPRDSIVRQDEFGPVYAEDSSGNVIQVIDIEYSLIQDNDIEGYVLLEDVYVNENHQDSLVVIKALGFFLKSFRDRSNWTFNANITFWIPVEELNLPTLSLVNCSGKKVDLLHWLKNQDRLLWVRQKSQK